MGRHLHVVDIQTGEVVESDDGGCGHPACVAVRQELVDLKEKVHDRDVDLEEKRRTIRAIKARLVKDLKEFKRHEEIERLFEFWKEMCNHPRSILDEDRADACRRILSLKREDGSQYKEEDGRLAIMGAALDPKTREAVKAGKSWDEFQLIFRHARQFERFAVQGAKLLRQHPEHKQAVYGDKSESRDGSQKEGS